MLTELWKYTLKICHFLELKLLGLLSIPVVPLLQTQVVAVVYDYIAFRPFQCVKPHGVSNCKRLL